MKTSTVPSIMLTTALTCLPVAALADPASFISCNHPERGIADVGVNVSTLGLGVGVAFPLNHCFALRLGVNQFNKGFSTSTATANSTVNYTGNLKLNSYDFLVDWRPFEGIFHLTAGAMYNNNRFDLNSTGPFTLNGVQYTAGSLSAAITFKSWAPYLGVGFSGQPAEQGWSFKSDFGVMFQGPPRATLTTTNAAAAAALPPEEAALNDRLSHYRYYPVIMVGVGYAF